MCLSSRRKITAWSVLILTLHYGNRFLVIVEAADSDENLRCSSDVSKISFTAYDLSTGDKTLIQEPDQSLQSVWIVHGYQASSESHWIGDIKDALISRHANESDSRILIVVNWSSYASGLRYSRAVCYVQHVAKAVVDFMDDVNINVELAHMIGHSLGAHVCGIVGNLLRDRENPKMVGHITGLDAARPTRTRFMVPQACAVDDKESCFELRDDDERLSQRSANFVDGYHTNAGDMGMTGNYAHVDVYFGMCGVFQCECPDIHSLFNPMPYIRSAITCSHTMAHIFYKNTISDGQIYKAKASDSCKSFLDQEDRSGDTAVGYDIDNSLRGTYFTIILDENGKSEEKCEAALRKLQKAHKHALEAVIDEIPERGYRLYHVKSRA